MTPTRTALALAAAFALGHTPACDSAGDATADTTSLADVADTVLSGADAIPLFEDAGNDTAAVETASSDVAVTAPTDTLAASDTKIAPDSAPPQDSATPEDTTPPQDSTAPLDTTPTQDTAAPQDTGPTVEACDLDGAVEPCVAACPDFQLPLRTCAGAGWGACSCRSVTRQHIAILGSATHAGFTGTPEGHLYACYSINGNLALAYQFTPAAPDNFDIQLLGAAGDSCDLDVLANERVHIVYGAADETGQRDLVYRTVLGSTLSAAEPILASNLDDGHEPRIALGSEGTVHLLAGAHKTNGDHVLRAYASKNDGGWFIEQLAVLPSATFTHALTVCGNGQPVALYGAVGDATWAAWLGTGTPEDGWETALLDDGSAKRGAGATLACDDGEVFGVYQDFTVNALLQTHSTSPTDLDSYAVSDVPTGFAVGLHQDLEVHGAWLYLSLAGSDGDVYLALRPRDLSSPWRVYKVAASSQLASGVLSGDVRLHVAPDGRPNLLYFGSFGEAEGVWLATID